jgi:ArsR family transcriptional regulator
LKVLREAGLVSAERDGKAVLYSLSPEFRAATKRNTIDLGCCLISFD